MLEKLLLPDIQERIQAGDVATLSEILNDWPGADTAALVEDLLPEERLTVLRVLALRKRVDAFEHLSMDLQVQLLAAFTNEEAAEILNNMAPDDRTALLDELPHADKDRMLTLLTPAERAVAEALLDYGTDTVGRLMTPDFLEVKQEWTVKRVLDHVRTHGRDSETLNHVYVTDAAGVLLDDLRIREVLLAPLHAHVSDIMDKQFVSLSVTDDRREAVEVFRKYDRTALPVIDGRGVLVGIVTHDDVIDIAEEEATKDQQLFGGVEALDESYRATPTLTLIKKRATWLVVLFLGELLTASAMAWFDDEIAKAVVLTLFIPLIISSGGNSGSQAATLLIRALAVREVSLSEWFWVFRRELISGLVLGLILGTIGFLRIALWSTFTDLYGPHWLLVGLTVSISLVGIVLWGTISGAMLPFILKRLGLDPATSSAPFVATLVDVTGLILYFTVASVLLRGTLL
ncbi:magnesium transporter [Planctomicrobium piriforme]